MVMKLLRKDQTGPPTAVPQYKEVHPSEFEAAISKHPDQASLSQNRDYTGKRTFLSNDGKSGYALEGGDLQSVFSMQKGHGAHAVRHAIANGAKTLDAFEGHLPKFYSQFGFKEHRREKNWTPGGPDVVYMSLPDKETNANLGVSGVHKSEENQMADDKVYSPQEWRREMAKAVQARIDSYSKEMLAMRQAELKKALPAEPAPAMNPMDMCPTCGCEDVPGKCQCLGGMAHGAPAVEVHVAKSLGSGEYPGEASGAPPQGQNMNQTQTLAKIATAGVTNIPPAKKDKRSVAFPDEKVKKNAMLGYGPGAAAPGPQPMSGGGMPGMGMGAGMRRSEVPMEKNSMCKTHGVMDKCSIDEIDPPIKKEEFKYKPDEPVKAEGSGGQIKKGPALKKDDMAPHQTTGAAKVKAVAKQPIQAMSVKVKPAGTGAKPTIPQAKGSAKILGVASQPIAPMTKDDMAPHQTTGAAKVKAVSKQPIQSMGAKAPAPPSTPKPPPAAKPPAPPSPPQATGSAKVAAVGKQPIPKMGKSEVPAGYSMGRGGLKSHKEIDAGSQKLIEDAKAKQAMHSGGKKAVAIKKSESDLGNCLLCGKAEHAGNC